MIVSSIVLKALTVSIFFLSASSVPISLRKTNSLHFFSGDCSDQDVQRQIKEQFIQMLNGSWFKDVCQADTLRDRCKADNVKVTCYSDTRRRRSLSGESTGYFYCDVILFQWTEFYLLNPQALALCAGF